MEEENFEKKKSSKKGLKIAILIIVLLAIAGVVTWFVLNKVNSKPEKVFDKAVEQMFEGTDKIKEYKTATVEMDISASIKEMNNGNMDAELKSQISMVNLVLQSLKLNTKMGVDMENKVLNWQVSADYMGDKLISLDTIVQDSKIYFYLEDLYSKYIELPAEYLEEFDLESIFSTGTTNIDEQMLKDIEEILKAKINESEFTTEDDKIEVEGKEKNVQKSTLTLTVQEVTELFKDILNKVKEYDLDSETKSMINEAISELEYTDNEDSKNVVEINIYTEKSSNEIVRYDINLVNNDDDEIISVVGAKVDDKSWEITIGMNEESTSTSSVVNLLTIKVTEENENEGKIEVTLYVAEEGFEATIAIDYKAEYDASIEKRNITNTIDIDEMTDADFAEIMENVEDNQMLYTIVQSFMEGFNEGLNGNSTSYEPYDSYYNY